MWNCSVDLLGKIVIFEPGIAFPFQTLARGSLDVKMNCVSQTNIQLSAFAFAVRDLGFRLKFLLSLSLSCRCVLPERI